MNKKIIATILFAIIILFLLITSLSFFRKNTQTLQESETVVPTQSYTKVEMRSDSPNVNESSLESLYQEQNKLLQSIPLSKLEIEALEKLRTTLHSQPEENDDFALFYSPDLDQFFVQLRSEGASEKFEKYLSKDPALLSVYNEDGYDYFQTSTAPPGESIEKALNQFNQYQEQKYQIYLDKEQDQSSSPSPTASYVQQRLQNQTSAFKNFITSFTSLNLKAPPAPHQPSVTLPILEPAIPSIVPSNLGAKSELDALFTEAGQRVEVPPGLIKGVMAHECGVLLSESTTNISAWSQPGAGLPITHKCFDGGVKKGDGLDLGPMQFYLPRYFEVYSQAVNQFGKYNRARPYVENIVDSVYASAYKLRLDSKSVDAVFSCPEVKRASWCYACGCSRFDNGNLNAYGCRFAPGLFQYLWGYYTVGKPIASNPPC